MGGELLWLGPAIQGGIGVVSLVVMFLLLRAFITSLDRRMEQTNQAIIAVNGQVTRVASMVAVLIGRNDVTPPFGVRVGVVGEAETPEPFDRRKAEHDRRRGVVVGGGKKSPLPRDDDSDDNGHSKS